MVNRVLQAALGHLFPQYCSLCRLPSGREAPLCRACEEDLLPNHHCCASCALPLPGTSSRPSLCGKCLGRPPAFDRVLAPWLYTEHMASLIQRWKFGGETRLTGLLADLWLATNGSPPPPDLLVPVPLHWRRLWRRGFNQSELLARHWLAVCPALATARLDHRLVRRARATSAQAGLNAAARRRNLRGAFTVNRACDKLRVAIVDDVLTTGATAEALAMALKAAGASRVEIWCIARTPSPGS